MGWLTLSLLFLVGGLAMRVILGASRRLTQRFGFLSRLLLELAGILFVSLLFVALAQLATAPGVVSQRQQPILGVVLAATELSSILILAATLWATLSGVFGAYAFTRMQRRPSRFLAIAAILWVIPTFLLAIAVQEVQGAVFSVTLINVSGGYAQINPISTGWAALVLGIRPAAYIFRSTRRVLGTEEREDHVRTAQAKGISWNSVAFRHILRPALGQVISTWLNSLRMMVGSLPLVEFFFAYPGLGKLFVTSLGLDGSVIDADLAISAVVGLAAIFAVLDALGHLLEQALDPRLHQLRRDDRAA